LVTAVSIIIVSYNTREPLEQCLRSIAGANPGVDAVVVDNGSTDGSVDLLQQNFPGVRLVTGRGNLGFAGGCNAGAKSSTGDYLLFLNSDCRVRPGAVEELASFLDQQPQATAVAGRLVDADGGTQTGFNVRRLPTVRSITADLLLLHRLLPANRLSASYRMAGFDHTETVEVEQPAGACLMVRRQVFEQLGGFDEAFHPAWFEDVDLCRRLKDSGNKIFFNPAAVFEHLGGATMRRLDFRRFTRMYYRNQSVYLKKHFRLLPRLFLRAMIAAGMGLRALLVLVSPMRFGGPVGQAGRMEAAGAFLSVIPPTLFGWPPPQESDD
jgi:N-acetylglucosaminyl-diphospho-decaprenol L-rhamnosyltransferase